MLRRSWVLVVTLLVLLCAAPVLAATFNGGNGPDNLVGTEGDDVMSGGNGPDTVSGLGGDDELSGGNGPDTLIGGNGFDHLDGDAGPDTLTGGPGADWLQADAGPDTLDGGEGNDYVARGSGGVTASGGAGNDVLLASEGLSALSGGDGDDLIHAGDHSGVATINGGAGDDVCYAEALDVLVGCETVVRVSSAAAAPSLAISSGPAHDATVSSSSASFSFSAANAVAVYCVPDTGAGVRCDSGSYTMSSLAPGTHALSIVAIGAGNKPAAAVMRRFEVVPSADAAISGFTSSTADTVTVAGSNLAGLDALKLYTADGQQLTYTLPDARVQFSALPQHAYAITDVNLGRETITRGLRRCGAGPRAQLQQPGHAHRHHGSGLALLVGAARHPW